MFDNLRESENERQAFQDAIGLGSAAVAPASVPRKPASAGLLGMSSLQRLIISLLLLVAVCVLGSMCLLVTGRISPF